jgi:prepilin-type N-terminal cleavage/methylation domain-containing protein
MKRKSDVRVKGRGARGEGRGARGKGRGARGVVPQGEGFTFIEMLIVTMMLALVSLAIYATFSNGIKIWHKVNLPTPEEDVNIFFDKFSSDLRNCFKFTGIYFSGTKDALEFATLVSSPQLQIRTVGKVIYSYTMEDSLLAREARDYSQMYTDTQGTVAQSMKNVKAVRFRYYYYDTGYKEYRWLDEWPKDETSKEALPLAVRVELEIGDGVQARTFTKTVSIPAGSQ